MSQPAPQSEAPQRVEVPGHGACLLPREFGVFTGCVEAVEVRDARDSAQALLERLAVGAAVVLTGPYPYVDASYRYCQHFERKLVSRREVGDIADRVQRIAAFAAARRRKLHHLLVLARGEVLTAIDDPPETAGLQDWLAEPTGEEPFLIPLRRLQRILTDMRRAREGIEIDGLEGRLTICPHVYVPADRSVPAMLCDCRELIHGRTVLDLGTGTGVLALLAARMGAARVVATDVSPLAVANARLNVQRLGLGDLVEVREAADLFEPVGEERFDVIVFNAPWLAGEPQTPYDTAIYDPGFRVIDGFLREAPQHLCPGGVVLLQYSDASQRTGEGGIARVHESARAAGLRVVSACSIARTSRVLGAREQVFLLELKQGQTTN